MDSRWLGRRRGDLGRRRRRGVGLARLALVWGVTLRMVLPLIVPLAHADCSPEDRAKPVALKPAYIAQNPRELELEFTSLDSSARRIPNRAYWDARSAEYRLPRHNGFDVLPVALVDAIRNHVEAALAQGWADFVLYPDLGHVHILVPSPETQTAPLLNPHMQLLYHTAELVDLKPRSHDPDQTWRERRGATRNLLGTLGSHVEVIRNASSGFNTVRGLSGYSERETLYFSPNREGCFPYIQNGQTKFMDITSVPIPSVQPIVPTQP